MMEGTPMRNTVLTTLLRWYDRHGRDLPWRKTRDTYALFVSEIMLQQTQVSRVVSYYRAWLKQFPDWKALAAAPRSAVIRAWSGLGYNRRALMLQEAAKQVVSRGEPRSREEWLQLKGVGAYTSAALSVFANRQPHLPIDTNVRRLLGRAYLGLPYPKPSADARLIRFVQPSFQRMKRFYDVPQAMFDLANAYCTKQPQCRSCPVRLQCAAAPKFLSGRVRRVKRTVVKSKERVRAGKRFPDRIYRGRILRAVQERRWGIPVRDIGPLIDPGFDSHDDAIWVQGMLERLSRDGLIRVMKNRVKLPV